MREMRPWGIRRYACARTSTTLPTKKGRTLFCLILSTLSLICASIVFCSCMSLICSERMTLTSLSKSLVRVSISSTEALRISSGSSGDDGREEA